MKILGIVGSKRKNGNTATLVNEALKAAEQEGYEVETIYLGDYKYSGCYGCEKCHDTFKCVIKDDMQKLYPKILEADAIVVGSPTYFYNISSDLKAFIERMYCFDFFDDDDRSVWMSLNGALGQKLAVTIAICEQHDIADMGVTSEVMDMSISSLGYRIVDSVKVLKLFEANAAKSNDTALMQAKNAGVKLVRTMRLKEKINEVANLE